MNVVTRVWLSLMAAGLMEQILRNELQELGQEKSCNLICQGHWPFSMGICKSGEERRSVGTGPGAAQQQGIHLVFLSSCVSCCVSCFMSWCS